MILKKYVLYDDTSNINFRDNFNKNEALEENTSKSTTVTNRQTSLTYILRLQPLLFCTCFILYFALFCT